jgi:two-component system, OmpR family, phosphate regulon sensor histidine kinase PhoR
MFGLPRIRLQLFLLVMLAQLLGALCWYGQLSGAALSGAGGARSIGNAGLLNLLVGVLTWVLVDRVAKSELLALRSLVRQVVGGDLKPKLRVSGGAPYMEVANGIQRIAKQLNAIRRQLRSERDRLDRVLSSMQEGVMLLDKDGHVQLVNESLRQMLLLGPDVLGQHVRQALPDEHLSNLLLEALEGKNNSREMDLSGPPPKQVLANVRRLRKRRGALAVLVDITARRKLETVRQEFVANASHELRTPIAAILSAAETLQGPASGHKEASVRFLGMIVRNASRLRNLVDDLLEVSQLESGKIIVDLEAINLKAAIESTLHTQVPRARTKNTNLVCLIPSGSVVLANTRGLDHVIGNLVQNAINYCPNESRVVVECEEDERSVTVCVNDNGPGIEDKHRERLFERFYRVDSGRSRDVGGTGLGLAIVKHWVDAMHGTISVSSVPGRGSSFRVTLSKPNLQPEDTSSAERAAGDAREPDPRPAHPLPPKLEVRKAVGPESVGPKAVRPESAGPPSLTVESEARRPDTTGKD